MTAVARALATLQALVLGEKGRCFRAVFRSDDAQLSAEGERVLGDLKRYCRGEASTFSPEPYQAARLAGRREVWLRIVGFLDLDEHQVRRLVEVENDYSDE